MLLSLYSSVDWFSSSLNSLEISSNDDEENRDENVGKEVALNSSYNDWFGFGVDLKKSGVLTST